MFYEDQSGEAYGAAEQKAYHAFELYEDGRITQALMELEEAIEINPASSAYHFNKALALDSLNKFNEAIDEYEVALTLSPNDVEILNSLAVDYTRIGYYDKAISIFEQIEMFERNFEPCYCNRIISYTEMGEHELAEQMFYLAQQLKADCPLCFYNIGNSLFVRGEYEKAIHCWFRTAEIEPRHPQINWRIAQGYWLAGEATKAKEYFLVELRNNPGDIDVILDFAQFLLEDGQVESAKEKFNRILELKPDFAPAIFYLGEIAYSNADYETAIKFYLSALQNDNHLKGPRYRLAQYELMNGNEKEAKVQLIEELILEPDSSAVLISMGTMFLQIGDSHLAKRCLLQAVDIDCTNAEAYYQLAVVNVLNNRLADAAELFSHTLDLCSEHIGALRDSTLIYLAMGRFSKAGNRLSKLSKLVPKSYQLHRLYLKIHLGRIRKKLDNFFQLL